MTKQRRPATFAAVRDGQRIYSPGRTYWADRFGDGWIVKGPKAFRLNLDNANVAQCMEALSRMEDA